MRQCDTSILTRPGFLKCKIWSKGYSKKFIGIALRHIYKKKKFLRCFDQWETHWNNVLNDKSNIEKKISAYFIVNFWWSCYIITEWFFLLIIFVNYILSFGLVGLWTTRLSAGAGAHIEYSSRSRTEDMTISNVIIKPQIGKCDWGVNDVMPGSEKLVISKKTPVEI